jgi:hypothetical protein
VKSLIGGTAVLDAGTGPCVLDLGMGRCGFAACGADGTRDGTWREPIDSPTGQGTSPPPLGPAVGSFRGEIAPPWILGTSPDLPEQASAHQSGRAGARGAGTHPDRGGTLGGEQAG